MGFYRRRVKRVLDVTLSSLALAVLALPMALVALAIRCTLGSPVIFRQKRIGRHNAEFTLLKFRTMTDRRNECGVLLPDSERLTGFGRFLRRLSIDETPSLINVLRGDMSLIGPRPLLVRYLSRYTPEQLRRHEMLPGLSCADAVRGRNLLSWEDKFKWDLWYVDHVSFRTDLRILLSTLAVALAGKGAFAFDRDSRAEFWGTAPVGSPGGSTDCIKYGEKG